MSNSTVEPKRRLHWSLWLGLILLLFLGLSGIGLASATRSQAEPERWWHSPFIAGHMYSVGLRACTPQEPGLLLFARDVLLSSRMPGPMLMLPVSPSCA